jgi:guanylate kinase
VNGADYFFVQPAVFQSLISEKAFLEWSIFSGNYYGTSNQTIEKAIDKGLTTILDVDMEGIKRLKESSLNANARYVFIKPPSFEALEKRLRNRDTEKEEDIRKRLAQASKELEYAGKPGVYDKIIVNDDLEKAYRELKDFVKDLH